MLWRTDTLRRYGSGIQNRDGKALPAQSFRIALCEARDLDAGRIFTQVELQSPGGSPSSVGTFDFGEECSHAHPTASLWQGYLSKDDYGRLFVKIRQQLHAQVAGPRSESSNRLRPFLDVSLSMPPPAK